MGDIGLNIKARDNASGTLDHISRKLGIFNKQGLAMGIGFAGITLGIQAAMSAFQGLKQHIAQSIKSFYEFEKSMAEAATMLDTMEKDLIPGMGEELTSMSIAFGQSAVDLSKGLYQALSAGVAADKAMKFMSQSAKLASAGLASVETTVDALTTVLNAYGMSVENVAYVGDIMMKTVELGKLRLEDLAGTLGYIAPIAAQAGVAFEEISAAMATLTKQGINAHMAARSLRQTIVNLISPSEEGKTAMIELGLAYDDLTLESRGLYATLELINDAADGQVGVLNQLIPNVRALSAVMGLTGTQSEMFAAGLREIENAAGTVNEKLKDVTSTSEYESRVLEALSAAQDRAFGESMKGWDLFWKENEARMKGGGWVGLIPTPPTMMLGGILGDQVSQQKIDAMKKAFGELETTVEHEYIDDFAASLNRLETEGQNQAILYERLTTRIAEYKQDVIDLNAQMEKTKATHDYKEALRYIPMALEEASYTNKIFDETTRALVDSIRIQRGEIERLTDANKRYSSSTRGLTIESMKIELDAMNKRGRYSKTQKKRLEEIRKEQLKNRIASMSNQQKMDSIGTGMTGEEKRLESIKRLYSEEIYLINDTYAAQIHSLERNINYKNLLIEEHLEDQDIALSNSKSAWDTYYDLVLDATEEWAADMQTYFKEVMGYSLGEGLEAASQAVHSLEPPAAPSTGVSGIELIETLLGGGFPQLQGGLEHVPMTGYYKLHEGEGVKTRGAMNVGGSGRVTVDLTGNLNVNLTRHIGAGDDPESWVAKKISDGVRRGLIKTEIITMYG
ncbi:MAG: phage tail tape measure protein [Candidatus Peribacteraceae bacterium]|nr:phage tail tape measure protein [Candidatus Peribacteraceae bacterium]